MAHYGARIYQEAAVDAAFDCLAGGARSALLVMPTGTGKTVVSASIIDRFARERGERVLFLAARKKLITQAFEKFTRYGLKSSIEMSGHDAIVSGAALGKSQVVCGSVQSLQSDRLGRWPRGEFGLILCDEAHHSLADQWTQVLGWFTGYRLLGLTATPDRGDQRNLGALFERKCFDYPIRTAINGDDKDDAGGWLVPPRVRRCPVSVDLRGIKVAGGDYSVGDLEERIGPNVEVLGRAIRAEIGARKTVVFTPDVGSAQAMADVLRSLELTSEYVAGSGGRFGMTEAEATAVMARFDSGEVQVLVNCELLVEGWDDPTVSAVVICRPTRKRYRYAQMVGRGLRPCEGKADCLVVDFDWQTDSEARDLAMGVDLFDDGSLPEEIIGIAREIDRHSRTTAEPKEDPLRVVEEAEEIFRIRSKLQIKLTGKSEKYRAIESDPIGVSKLLDIKFKSSYDMDRRGDNPASPAQIGMLKGLGVREPGNVSKWGASKIIDRLVKRKEQGFSGPGTVKALLVAGVDPSVARGLSADAARHALDSIKYANSILPPKQQELFQ